MEPRSYPQFSLCGLNCSLCPRFNSTSPSRCPGCGGPDFSEKHPSCSIMSCNKKKENVTFCFECSQYPCAKYPESDNKDSFVSYLHRKKNMEYARTDLEGYLMMLAEKSRILRNVLDEFNDGRSLSFFCTAVNNLELDDLYRIEGQLSCLADSKKIKELFMQVAYNRNITLKLRK